MKKKYKIGKWLSWIVLFVALIINELLGYDDTSFLVGFVEGMLIVIIDGLVLTVEEEE